MSNPFYDLCCHRPNKGELLSKILLYEFENITKKGKMFVTMISFSQPGIMDQRCSERLQSVTRKMDITGLHSAEGHCSLQYSQLYSTSSEIADSIDHLITIIILFTDDVNEQTSAEDNEYGSTGWAVWLTKTRR
jgi:hypothetical protein